MQLQVFKERVYLITLLHIGLLGHRKKPRQWRPYRRSVNKFIPYEQTDYDQSGPGLKHLKAE